MYEETEYGFSSPVAIKGPNGENYTQYYRLSKTISDNGTILIGRMKATDDQISNYIYSFDLLDANMSKICEYEVNDWQYGRDIIQFSRECENKLGQASSNVTNFSEFYVVFGNDTFFP